MRERGGWEGGPERPKCGKIEGEESSVAKTLDILFGAEITFNIPLPSYSFPTGLYQEKIPVGPFFLEPRGEHDSTRLFLTTVQHRASPSFVEFLMKSSSSPAYWFSAPKEKYSTSIYRVGICMCTCSFNASACDFYMGFKGKTF